MIASGFVNRAVQLGNLYQTTRVQSSAESYPILRALARNGSIPTTIALSAIVNIRISPMFNTMLDSVKIHVDIVGF